MADTNRPYAFGISEFTTWPWTFEEDVEHYAKLGVDTIEVCEFKLDDKRTDEQMLLIEKHGLAISSVQPDVRTLFPGRMKPDPKDPRARMARFQDAIKRLSHFGTEIPFVTNTGKPPNGNMQQVFDVAAKEYRTVADCARDCGARVALEPLNPSTMNEESAIWSLQQALRIVEAVDRPNFGVCVDFWNLWQTAGVVEALAGCGDRTFVVQLADWRTPRSFADRIIVGQGDIDFTPLLHATRANGYRSPYVVEIFSQDVPDSLYDMDLDRLIKENQAGFRRAWQEAFGTSSGAEG